MEGSGRAGSCCRREPRQCLSPMGSGCWRMRVTKSWGDKTAAPRCNNQTLQGPEAGRDSSPTVLLLGPTGSQKLLGGEGSWGEGRADGAGLQVCRSGVMGNPRAKSGSTGEWACTAMVCAVPAFTCLNSHPLICHFSDRGSAGGRKRMTLLLLYLQKVSGSLTLRPGADVIHLTASHHAGILPFHVMAQRRGRVGVGQ